MTRALIVIALLGGVAAQAFAQDVAVHVRAAGDDAQFIDADLKKRKDVVADLRKAFEKTKGIVLVDDQAQAQVRIEITGRAYEETGAMNRRTKFEIGLMLNR